MVKNVENGWKFPEFPNHVKLMHRSLYCACSSSSVVHTLPFTCLGCINAFWALPREEEMLSIGNRHPALYWQSAAMKLGTCEIPYCQQLLPKSSILYTSA